MNTRHQVYESIGVGYASARRPDPPIHLLIVDALGDARTVLNVGAGGGNYEPSERSVIAVEPSLRMISQRRYGSGPALQVVAEALPFSNKSFDAALATFTLHHWTNVSAGLLELKRVAKRQVILLFEPAESLKLWLVEYFPECLALPSETGAPGVNDVRPVLDVRNVSPVPVPADCTDGFAGAYWRRPEAYLDPVVRAGISSLALLSPNHSERGARRLREGLASAEWDARFGFLGELPEFDLGYRLVVAG